MGLIFYQKFIFPGGFIYSDELEILIAEVWA